METQISVRMPCSDSKSIEKYRYTVTSTTFFLPREVALHTAAKVHGRLHQPPPPPPLVQPFEVGGLSCCRPPKPQELVQA